MKFAQSFAVLAVSFASITAQAATRLSDTPAAKQFASQLAGRTYLALPSEDAKNLDDSYEDNAAVRKIVFGADGTISISLPADSDSNLSDAQALATDFKADVTGTWMVSVPDDCGDAGCAPFIVVKDSKGTQKYFFDLDAQNGDLRIDEFHAESVLHVVK